MLATVIITSWLAIPFAIGLLFWRKGAG